MRIPCPYCGPRSHEEFSYGGEATLVRPDAGGADAQSAYVDYVYLRANPMGLHRELWYHGLGCQSWLVVERDTRTHEIGACFPAGGDSAAAPEADA